MELHKSEECPNTLRKCVFAVAGCSYEVTIFYCIYDSVTFQFNRSIIIMLS